MRITKNQSRTALNWFLKFIKTNTANKATMAKHNVREYSKSTEQTFIGDVFLFCDRRFKDAKDYPDLFPLVVPVRVYGDGFYALNLHLIEQGLRMKLIKKLLSFKMKFPDEVYSVMTFKLLRGVSRMKSFEHALQFFPAVSVKSDFIRLPPTDWLRTIALPLHVKVKEE